jgi:membrane dipeptidase
MSRAFVLPAALLLASCRSHAPGPAGDGTFPAAVAETTPGAATGPAADVADGRSAPEGVRGPGGAGDGEAGAAAEQAVDGTTATEPFADALAVDLHADVVEQITDHGWSLATDDGEWTIDRARRGGLDAQVFPLWISPRTADQPAALKNAARAFTTMIEQSGGALAVVRTSAELRERAAAGGLGALLGMEGALPLGDDPANVDPYVALGLRYLGLTWNASNAFAEAAADEREPHGLTETGRTLVRRLNDAGVLVDLAHASAATFWDAYRVSRAPLLVSHAGLRALRNIGRNIDDLQLLALARTGGVVGVIWHSGFLTELPEGETVAPLDALVAHYAHAKALGATSALALGSDLSGGIHPPRGLETIAELPALTAALRERGWTDDELRGVLAEDFLRLLDAADAAATATEVPAREWPATTECRGLATTKEAERLVDRFIVPGPAVASGVAIDVSWAEAADATAAVLEVWGEPGAAVKLFATEGPSSAEAGRDLYSVVGPVSLGAAGNARLELPAEALTARRVLLAPLAPVAAARPASEEQPVPVRLDEVAIWLR